MLLVLMLVGEKRDLPTCISDIFDRSIDLRQVIAFIKLLHF